MAPCPIAETSPEGPQLSERATATRKRIFSVALKAFAAKGYAETNLTEDILAPAGISVGSFYHQFRDKNDLFIQLVNSIHGEIQDRLSMVQQERPLEELELMAQESFELLFDLIDENPDYFLIQLKESQNSDPNVREALLGVRKSWLKSMRRNYETSADPKSNLDLSLIADLIGALSIGTISQYLELEFKKRASFRERRVEAMTLFSVGGIVSLYLDAQEQ